MLGVSHGRVQDLLNGPGDGPLAEIHTDDGADVVRQGEVERAPPAPEIDDPGVLSRHAPVQGLRNLPSLDPNLRIVVLREVVRSDSSELVGPVVDRFREQLDEVASLCQPLAPVCSHLKAQLDEFLTPEATRPGEG